MANSFAEIVILGTALDKSLHYAVPAAMAETVRPGSIVSVELGRRKVSGVVLTISKSPPDLPDNIKIRPILDPRGPERVLPDDLLRLCRWISEYYFYPLGEVLSFAVPGLGAKGGSAPGRGFTTRVVTLDAPVCGDVAISEKGREVLDLLESSGRSLPLKDLRRACKNTDYWLRKFVREGIVKIEERVEDFACRGFPQTPAAEPVELTVEQKEALDILAPHVENASFRPFVLYGVTGSGKTEIYLRLIEKAAMAGRGSLLLVPEIALSTQMESICRRRLDPLPAIWHSAVSPKERRRQWAEILDGKRNVVLGARSAVLTPLQNLGLIIVDEEHDPSYKQEDRLRYNARDVAIMRAKILGIPIVLGSATPSLQTVHRRLTEQYSPVILPSRIFGRPLPALEIVDMKREGGRGGIFSAKLREGIAGVLGEGRQALVFLNRRGYAKFYLCNACGHVLQCVSCSLTLTYHKKEDCLRCHYCGWETALPERCPVCGHAALFAHGFGTERVEKEIGRLFPGARLVRVDRDTMSSHEKLLDALDSVRSGRADILLGTQMIAKGHDFPNITLVGVINADAGLQVCDFRAGENLVQLLFQVAGRAGRGEEPGRVILQTYNPYHYTLESLLKMDYDGFCERELESRKALQYPPFTRLLKFLVTARNESAARAGAQLLAAVCREKASHLKESGRHVAVLGPSPAAYVKLRDRFRWQVFIKTWQSSDMQSFAEVVLDWVKNDTGLRDAQVTVDRDPSNDI
ncbi:MAG: primosomal protein N' [Syntrophobacteraceae bacterium]